MGRSGVAKKAADGDLEDGVVEADGPVRRDLGLFVPDDAPAGISVEDPLRGIIGVGFGKAVRVTHGGVFAGRAEGPDGREMFVTVGRQNCRIVVEYFARKDRNRNSTNLACGNTLPTPCFSSPKSGTRLANFCNLTVPVFPEDGLAATGKMLKRIWTRLLQSPFRTARQLGFPMVPAKSRIVAGRNSLPTAR